MLTLTPVGFRWHTIVILVIHTQQKFENQKEDANAEIVRRNRFIRPKTDHRNRLYTVADDQKLGI